MFVRVCVTAMGVAGVLAATAPGATPPAQIRVTDVQLAYRMTHPQGGGQAGSIETIRQRLYNLRISKSPIGRSVLTCTFTDTKERTCNGTYVLPRGSLVVAGTLTTRLLYEVAIVGGTGLYDNARGVLTVTATHVRPRREILLFRLVG